MILSCYQVVPNVSLKTILLQCTHKCQVCLKHLLCAMPSLLPTVLHLEFCRTSVPRHISAEYLPAIEGRVQYCLIPCQCCYYTTVLLKYAGCYTHWVNYSYSQTAGSGYKLFWDLQALGRLFHTAGKRGLLYILSVSYVALITYYISHTMHAETVSNSWRWKAWKQW